VHFEIHASDPVTLGWFYQGLFGWQFQQWGQAPYWLITTTTDGEDSAPGINGGMVPRPTGESAAEGAPVNAFVITVDVPDCAGYVDKALAAGATIAVPRQAMPGMGWLAYIKDPDGNILGLMQTDPTAS